MKLRNIGMSLIMISIVSKLSHMNLGITYAPPAAAVFLMWIFGFTLYFLGRDKKKK